MPRLSGRSVDTRRGARCGALREPAAPPPDHLDKATLEKAARETKAIITVEDHRPAGGLGEAVMSALATASRHVPIHSLAARKTPRSGKPQELLADQEIDASAIEKKVNEILGQ